MSDPLIETAFALLMASFALNPYFYSSRFDFRVMMPTYRAIATAVADWSPVTITIFTPEALHFLTALSTPGLGGSARDNNPTNVKLSN
jgi:hypothetical protein